MPEKIDPSVRTASSPPPGYLLRAPITLRAWEDLAQPRRCFQCDRPENSTDVALIPLVITPRKVLCISALPALFLFLCPPCWLGRTEQER